LEPLTLITEIKPLLPARLAGEQHQRPPFFQGQLLHGVISAKGDANRFTLEINGQPITAESSAPLRVGQQLNLQVTSLTPRVELQIVGTDPANRWLGNVLPLLNQQSSLLPEVTALAGDSRLMSQLSVSAQETLRFYAGDASGTGSGDPAKTYQLLGAIVRTLTAAPGQQFRLPNQELSALLQQLASAPSLAPKTAEQAARLASSFAQTTDQQTSVAPPSPSAAPASVPTPEEAAEVFFASPERTAAMASATTTLLAQLLPLTQEYAALPTTHPLRQLLAFLIQVESERSLPTHLQGSEPKLEQYLNRLGLDLERLLAENKPVEVARTLKFALLELSQQPRMADESTVMPDRLVHMLDMFQLLQIRLASESLLFLPLPFPFLKQGYLLVENDTSGKQSETTSDRADQGNQTVELRLQLEGLGNMQIDIRRQEDRITLRFLAENAEKAKFVAEFREELEQRIASGSLESVQFLVGAREPVRTLLEKIMPGGAGMIDTKA